MEIIYIAILTVFATGIGTLTGFGTSTIMVPVLLLFFPLAPTLLLVGIIHWFGDIWKIALFRQGVRWRLILLFGVPGVIFSFLGVRLVFAISGTLLSQTLGGFLVAYVVFLFLNPTFKFKQNALTATIGGALSGFSAGIFGVGGEIRGAFLSVFDLSKAVYIATAGAIGLAIDSTRLVAYWQGGATLGDVSMWSLPVFIGVSFIGAGVAKKIVDKIPQKTFRTVIAVFLFAVGAKLILFS